METKKIKTTESTNVETPNLQTPNLQTPNLQSKNQAGRLNLNQTFFIWASYFFYLLIIPALIGLTINVYQTYRYNKVNKNTQQTVDKSLFEINLHHHWLMRTFIVVMLLSMASVGTMFYGFGYLIALGTILWWFYRIFRGMFSLTQHKALPIEI